MLRSFLFLLAAGFSFGATAQVVYPNRPIRLIVGFAAGSGLDILARPFAAQLEAKAGTPVVIDNRPGNNGNLSVVLAASAKPDGYTLLYGSGSTIGAAPSMVKDFPIDVTRAIVPVRSLSSGAFVLTVAGTSPVSSVAELTKQLRGRDRNKFGYATNISQVAAHLFLARMGVDAAPVSYRTGPDALGDVVSGVLDFFIMDSTFALGQINNGKLKGLAVTSAQRSFLFPSLPTMEEAGVSKYDFSPWHAIFVPSGTPAPILQQLDGWLASVLGADAAKSHYEKYGASILNEDADAVRARIQREIEMWAEAVKIAGLTPQ